MFLPLDFDLFEEGIMAWSLLCTHNWEKILNILGFNRCAAGRLEEEAMAVNKRKEANK